MTGTSLKPVTIKQQIESLKQLLNKLSAVHTVQEKLNFLYEQPYVREYLANPSPFLTFLSDLAPEEEFAIKSVLAIGQGPFVFRGTEELKEPREEFNKLLQVLLQMESIYQAIGGIIGYHMTILKLIMEKGVKPEGLPKNIRYIKPEGFEINKENTAVDKFVRFGVKHLPEVAEIYPVGGAGDRLRLLDEKTGKPLPAAMLNFCGRTLLEGLLRDLQAREYLFYKLTGKRVITPVALMTSHEKDNHRHVLEICKSHQWFGRPKESFMLFTQPLVPVVTVEGNWSMQSPLHPTLKPGGHGLLWKLALEAGVFDWFEKQNRKKAIIRQINNPVAGTDNGLLILSGIGCEENKSFGFASCPRLLNAPEGMNVMIETKVEKGFEYCLTNIEYTEFERKGIKDVPTEPGSRYSAFPSNTNILFADLKEVRHAAEACPIPGMLVNMKNKAPFIDKEGHTTSIEAGRLESTMQNIADYIVQTYPHPLAPEKYDRFKTFITYNLRRKTISVTKSLLTEGKETLGTPEGCFYEILQNNEELLRDFCHFELPELEPEEDYLLKGPSFIVLYHPALGPQYSVIGQKIQRGKLEHGAELQLEIAELEISDLQLKGSLRITAENIMGGKDEIGNLVYGDSCGKCILKNVSVRNKGINRKATHHYWTGQIARDEELSIKLQGGSEFIAEDVVFEGEYSIDVPQGHRMIAYQDGKKVKFKTEKLKDSASLWNYSFGEEDRVALKKS